MQVLTHRGRITSLHGVLLPPKKKERFNKYLTLRFVIKGVIPSKKNMIWADSNFNKLPIPDVRSIQAYREWLKENMRVYIRNSEKYKNWVDETRPTMLTQAEDERKRYGIEYPLKNVTVKVYHYWKDNQARDNSNKYDTIIDLFSSSGIITDDCWQVVRRNESESACYHGEILDHITTIDVTVRMEH